MMRVNFVTVLGFVWFLAQGTAAFAEGGLLTAPVRPTISYETVCHDEPKTEVVYTGNTSCDVQTPDQGRSADFAGGGSCHAEVATVAVMVPVCQLVPKEVVVSPGDSCSGSGSSCSGNGD